MRRKLGELTTSLPLRIWEGIWVAVLIGEKSRDESRVRRWTIDDRLPNSPKSYGESRTTVARGRLAFSLLTSSLTFHLFWNDRVFPYSFSVSRQLPHTDYGELKRELF